MKKLLLLILMSNFLFNCSSVKVYYSSYKYENTQSIANTPKKKINQKHKNINKITQKNKVETFIENAKFYLKTPYKYGGQSKNGIDCSGLINMAYLKTTGEKLPRRVIDIYKISTFVEYPKRGDLIFFRFKLWNYVDHIGIYLGNNKFIHASTSHGVIISQLNKYYKKKVVCYRRLKL